MIEFIQRTDDDFFSNAMLGVIVTGIISLVFWTGVLVYMHHA
jgi:hypothetical protein